MADFTAKDVLIGLVMAMFFIVGGVALMGEFAKEPSSYINAANISTFNQTFNKYGELSEGVTDMSGSVSSGNATGSVGENTQTFQDNILLQSWNALTSIGNLFSFAFSATGGMFKGLADLLLIPGWVVSFIATLMLVALIWVILSLILRKG